MLTPNISIPAVGLKAYNEARKANINTADTMTMRAYHRRKLDEFIDMGPAFPRLCD